MNRTLKARADHLPLIHPFRISRGVKTAADAVVVELAYDGVVGRGEAIPYPRYGESVDSVLRQIDTVQSAVEEGANQRDLFKLLSPGAARNAIDCALWDLEARQTGRSVASITGIEPPAELITAVTVGLDSPEGMARSARQWGAAPLVKVKVDAIDPAAQITAVRNSLPEAQLIVDPNESWNLDILQQIQPTLEVTKVTLVEQPLPAGTDAALTGFKSAIPICADESCHTEADLEPLVGRYQYVNIKLDKTGGLTAALDLLAAARAGGFGIMTGCMICSSLSIAPAWLIASQSDFADLDGPLWLKDDRPGGVTQTRAGWLDRASGGFWGEAG
jgi:L-alanine-DL-glutamate epimerase-like enolase superfamily enzyme